MAFRTARSAFKLLHNPGKPIILPNIYDPSSLSSLLLLNAPNSPPVVQATATASWAIAAGLGIKDEELTLDQNLAAFAKLAPLAHKASLPISIDLQDGYGDRIVDAVAKAAELGAAGANIEDSIPSEGFSGGVEKALYPVDVQVQRLKRALKVAPEDFVVNARCDVFRLEPYAKDNDEAVLGEAIRRGKAYLDAGATTVFYWGGSGRGLRTSEVERLVKELEGRVAVKLQAGERGLSTAELAQIGVARISVGPELYRLAMKAVREEAAKILGGGRLSA
ncbi:hypothetical protein jhhlp_002126 [Lomentospora prolificans]|uniref:HpcH/HpaI aldolase/citrate lyase domain-containing protein n=1 Tax=Lomentospora prolificans TaxID=41688 RepID=A0A2N3ND53_9PEZI|nr:hypothetical protein jhhlp_002126 [Lomentospora prolificans]